MHFALRLSTAAIGALLPATALAQINPCPIPGIPCFTSGPEELAAFGMTTVFTALRIAFIGIMIFFFFMYALRLILESEEDGTVADVKNAYAQGVTGAAVVGLATLIMEAFGHNDQAVVVNPEPLEFGIANVIYYMRLMVGIAVGVLVVFQGIRLIVLQGQESELDEQKKRFFNGLIGVVIVLVADRLVEAVNPDLSADSSIAGEEIIGMANFLLTIISGLAMIAVISAGVFMIFSNDDGGRDKAKRIIFATAIGLTAAMACYLIVAFFIA